MALKISINNLYFILLCVCIIVFPLNYKIIASFRLLDVFFILLFILFLLSNPKVNKRLLIVFFAIIVVLATSSFFGAIKQHASIDLIQLGFIYKYLFIFTVPWLFISIVKTNFQIKVINWMLLTQFIILSSWTYVYLYLLASGEIVGSFRPSFPFSDNYWYTDAHVYSSYLGLFIVGYVFYLRRFFFHNLFISSVITINGISGLFLTGSRTGLVVVVFSILVYWSYISLKIVNLRQCINIKKITSFILLGVSFTLGIFFIYTFNIVDYSEDYNRLIDRSLNFDLANDESSLSRVNKLLIGIKDAEYSGLLLGLGFYSSLIWYDGLFSLLLAHGGFLLIGLIFLFYFIIVRKALLHSTHQKMFLTFFLLLFCYVISNLITEHVFIARNSFPALTLLSILYINIVKGLQDK